MKIKVIEDNSVRPSKIEICTSLDTDILLLKNINQLRDNVYRARRLILPISPKIINEVHKTI